MSSWQELTDEEKQKAREIWDFESRIASKNSENYPVAVPKILRIMETRSEMSDGKTIIRCDMDTLTIWFIGKENLTRIDRGWSGEIVEEMSETRQENRYEILNRFLISITNEGVIEAESVEIKGVTFPPPPSWKPKCSNLKLLDIEMEQIPAWITSSFSISRKFKKLEIDCWSIAEPLGALIHNIEVSETFRVLCESGMTDEELEKIEALDVSITSDQISIEAARKRLENFIKFGKRTDKLELRILHPQFFDAKKDLLSVNWKVTKTKKDYEEEGEFDGKIISGFENVHGILDTRTFTAEFYGDALGVYCSIFAKSETPMTMYPF